MSRASLSTGGVVFGSGASSDGEDQRHDRDDSGQPMHILFMGDFSGRAGRVAVDLEGLAKRKIVELNRDNFEEVFTEFNVQLNLPSSEAAIGFSEFDDLHPDHLYRYLPLFDELRELKRRLLDPGQFDAAAQTVMQWQADLPSQVAEGVAIPVDLFEKLLSDADSAPMQSVNDLIQSIVAPFVIAKPDPRSADLIAAVEQAMAKTLRTLMHAGAFQRLEANWRSLYWLARNIQTGSNLKLFLLDVSPQEVAADFAQCLDVDDTALFQRVVSRYQVPGATLFAVLVSDIMLEDKAAHIPVAAGLSALAVSSDAIALMGASEKIAGCESLAATPDIEDWCYEPNAEFLELWEMLREEPQSESLLVAVPRFLLRLPYGAKTSPIDSFAFEELGQPPAHPYYLWASGAYLAARLIADTFEQRFWDFESGVSQKVEDLPMHIALDEDGDSQAKACAEIYMTDKTAAALIAAGLCPLRSMKNESSVLVPRLNSMAISEALVLNAISA